MHSEKPEIIKALFVKFGLPCEGEVGIEVEEAL